MKKLAVFIIMLIALGVLLYFFGGRKPPEVQMPAPDVQEEQSEPQPHEAAPILDDPCKELRGDDRDQCYQEQAWQSGNIEYCALIESERFRHLPENPPRDKCYSMVAAKLCDPALCDKIDPRQSLFTPLACKQRISRVCAEVR